MVLDAAVMVQEHDAAPLDHRTQMCHLMRTPTDIKQRDAIQMRLCRDCQDLVLASRRH